MMKSLVMISLFMGLHSLVIADAQAAPPPLEDGVKVLRNLEYSRPEGRPLLLDLYLPPAGQGRPAVVMWIHGGGWKNGSKEPCRASWLAAKGYAVASINYRLLPNQWPSQMEDCRAAVRWLRTNASTHGFDASRVAAWGGSAGPIWQL